MEKYKKIVSFLPSATEILFEIGLGQNVYGVTHECTFPAEALKKSVVIRPVVDFDSMSGLEIDQKIKDLYLRNQPIFSLDEKLIKEIQPDLLISQNLCSVCAPFENEIVKANKVLNYKPKNLILNPINLKDIFGSIIIMGNEIGNLENAIKLRDKLDSRIHEIQTILESTVIKENTNNLPRIMCLDWINPFYLAGHWVPDMVSTSGGLPVGTINGGMDSRQITLPEIEKINPDKIVITPCGYDLKRTQSEYEHIDSSRGRSLKAYKDDQIYLVDSNSYFSKPSPRIVTGIEILCRILHPDLFGYLATMDDSFLVADR